MKQILCFLVLGFSWAAAQAAAGNWVYQELTDPFIDDERIVLVIGEDGESYTGRGSFFGLICENGVLDVIYFQMGGTLSGGEMRSFDYRVNRGDILSAEAWTEGSLVSLRPDEDDFLAFKNNVLIDGADLAIAAESSSGNRFVNEFDLADLDAALDDIGCRTNLDSQAQ